MPVLESSFRDPSGFVFLEEGTIYRQVNTCFADSYDKLMQSGLYEALTSRQLLIEHVEHENAPFAQSDSCYKVLKPTKIPYVSYPYEWSFTQLKDAALLTLRAQAVALEYGFVLKDASAYNVQFLSGKAILIDTLSFVPRAEDTPWDAYGQFCKHFLAPLALMSFTDVNLSKLLASYIDGIPLALASRLLPKYTWLKYALLVHIHVHARMQLKYADEGGRKNHNPGERDSGGSFSAASLRAIAESLAGLVDRLSWNPGRTEWGDYYDNTNYSDIALSNKRDLVESFIGKVDGPLDIVQDLGANNGEFSRIASRFAGTVVSQDIDPSAVEFNYKQLKSGRIDNVLPLLLDLCAPSPAIGWANTERLSFVQRAHCDLVLALALIHHLAISNNLPLPKLARFFASLAPWLIVEFVPKSDSQVERLLLTREDIFPGYSQEGFEAAFCEHFQVIEKMRIGESERTLFLFRRVEQWGTDRE